MIGMQMSGFQDIYEVTENLGEPSRLQHRLKKSPFCYSKEFFTLFTRGLTLRSHTDIVAITLSKGDIRSVAGQSHMTGKCP